MSESAIERIYPQPSVERITKILTHRFGRPALGNKKNPFNELLYIILSSKTRPKHYQETYRALRRTYIRASDLANTNPRDVAQTINRGGLQNLKARNIVRIAQCLKKEFGRVTLAPLARMPDQEAEDFLVSLPGVSKKTARCVMMYALSRDVFPVDSNCFRISQRLGWISSGASLTNRQADIIQAGIPSHLRRDLHVAMVVLGRRYCLPKIPCCHRCPLAEICLTGRKA
ncbi:endonuclease III domain-containing protein [Candidatus Poribacteria bacterium]